MMAPVAVRFFKLGKPDRLTSLVTIAGKFLALPTKLKTPLVAFCLEHLDSEARHLRGGQHRRRVVGVRRRRAGLGRPASGRVRHEKFTS